MSCKGTGVRGRNEFRKESGGSKGAYVGVIEQKEKKKRKTKDASKRSYLVLVIRKK